MKTINDLNEMRLEAAAWVELRERVTAMREARRDNQRAARNLQDQVLFAVSAAAFGKVLDVMDELED